MRKTISRIASRGGPRVDGGIQGVFRSAKCRSRAAGGAIERLAAAGRGGETHLDRHRVVERREPPFCVKVGGDLL